jgi:hypothetical protein
MQVECSNCLNTITVSPAKGEATYTVPASGRAGKRTAATTTTTPVWHEGHLIVWEAPCCDDYVDSLEP